MPHEIPYTRSEDPFRSFFVNTTIGFYRTTPDGKILMANPALYQLLGYDSFEALAKRNLSREGFEPDYPREEFMRRMENEGRVIGLEAAWKRRDGSPLFVRESATRIRDEAGETLYYEGTVEDITEKKQAELSLRESEERNRLLIQQSPLGIMMLDAKGNPQIINKSLVNIMGLSSIEAAGKINFLNHSLTKKSGISSLLSTCIKTGRSLSGEISYQTPDNLSKVLNYHGDPIHDAKGAVTGIQFMVEDITQKKRTEERIRKELAEKEILIKEIHHRVKNNLQIISSLIGLQAHHVRDPKTLDMFRESQDRIRSLALIHEHLYGSPSLAEVDIPHYLNTLLSGLYHTYCPRPGRITYEIQADRISLGVDSAIPCGLIINELFSNALKHAFTDERKEPGKIIVTFSRSGKNFGIVVQDDGRGLPPDLDIRKTESLGLHLVYMLAVKQLRGSCNVTREGGTAFNISFKLSGS
ncbi:MAG TPA: PAS domain S-box protein [bacterium]|nr:PAS domain S-box protein [bacterium]